MTEAHIIIEDIAQDDAAKHLKLIAVSGQLDESNIDEKAQEIYALLTQNPQGLYMIFDFEKLEYMNSKSIGYLTDWFGKVTEGQGKIVIIKAKPNIIDILQVIGLTQLIPMFATLEEAKFALMSTPATQTPAPSTTEPVISMPAVTPVVATAAPTEAPVVAPEVPVTAAVVAAETPVVAAPEVVATPAVTTVAPEQTPGAVS